MTFPETGLFSWLALEQNLCHASFQYPCKQFVLVGYYTDRPVRFDVSYLQSLFIMQGIYTLHNP